MRCVLEKTHCVVALLRLALRLTIASQSAIAAAATLSEEAIETFNAHCDVAAWDLLLPYGDVVIVLSTGLRIKRTLDGAEIDKIISDLQARKALAIEGERRKRWQLTVANSRAFLEALARSPS
jgi:uncharacterized protein (DUF1778 family)